MCGRFFLVYNAYVAYYNLWNCYLFNHLICQRDMSLCLKLLNFCGMRLRNKATVRNLPQGANLLPNQQWVVQYITQNRPDLMTELVLMIITISPISFWITLVHLVENFEVTAYFSLYNKIYMQYIYIYIKRALNNFLHVSTLHGCHHQGVSTVVLIFQFSWNFNTCANVWPLCTQRTFPKTLL